MWTLVGVLAVVAVLVFVLVRKSAALATVRERRRQRKATDAQVEKLKDDYKKYHGKLGGNVADKLRKLRDDAKGDA